MENTAAPHITAWAARFAVADAAAAARLRLLPGVTAAVVGDALWLRGPAWSDGVGRALDLAAPIEIYRLNDRRLTPTGRLLATDDLPDADWQPIAAVLTLAVPAAATPGAVPSRVALTVTRAAVEHAPTGLRLPFESFADWCDTAAAVRLARLRFAVQGAEALVLGTPLPPLAGVPLYASDGIVLPCGFALSPPVDASSLRLLLDLADGEVALFDARGWSRIAAAAFVPATRAAVRLTRLGAIA